MYCYTKIHWSVILFKIHIWFFKIQCISHLKNIGSVSYADILNIDTFLYSKKKITLLISPLTYQRSQGLGNCQDHGSGCKLFRIFVWKFKFYYWPWQKHPYIRITALFFNSCSRDTSMSCKMCAPYSTVYSYY